MHTAQKVLTNRQNWDALRVTVQSRRIVQVDPASDGVSEISQGCSPDPYGDGW